MTNDELDVHARAWQRAADLLAATYSVDTPYLVKRLPEFVAQGYREQKVAPPLHTVV